MPTRDTTWQATQRMFGRNCEWTHESGAIVRHCGHPTALRPYYIIGGNGAYRLLRDAQAAALEQREEA
jgi:hypothetical protein